MANLIGDASKTLQVMKFCNEGNDDAALKLCSLDAAPEKLEGNFIDRCVQVANNITDNSPKKGILVTDDMKNASVSDSVNDVVENVQEFSEDVVTESASSHINGVNYLLNEFDWGSIFNKADEVGDNIKDGVKTVVRDGAPVTNNIKYASDAMNNKDLSQFGLDGAHGISDAIKRALGDTLFIGSAVFQFIARNFAVIGGLSALGMLIVYVIYPLWKEKKINTVEDVKAYITSKFTSNKITNESAVEFLSLLKEDGKNDWHDTGNNVPPVNTAVTNVSDYHDGGNALGDIEAAKLARQNQADSNLEGQGNLATKDNKVGAPEDSFMGILSKFGQNVADFFKSIPSMVKDFTEQLTGPEGIHGKQLYITLLVSALVAASAIYAIYKLRKKKVDSSKAVAESTTVFDTLVKFNKKVSLLLKESVAGDGNGVYFNFISGATDAGTELFEDTTFKSSSMYPFAEKCLAKMAAPYDEYLQDLSSANNVVVEPEA